MEQEFIQKQNQEHIEREREIRPPGNSKSPLLPPCVFVVFLQRKQKRRRDGEENNKRERWRIGRWRKQKRVQFIEDEEEDCSNRDR